MAQLEENKVKQKRREAIYKKEVRRLRALVETQDKKLSTRSSSSDGAASAAPPAAAAGAAEGAPQAKKGASGAKYQKLLELTIDHQGYLETEIRDLKKKFIEAQHANEDLVQAHALELAGCRGRFERERRDLEAAGAAQQRRALADAEAALTTAHEAEKQRLVALSSEKERLLVANATRGSLGLRRGS